MKELTSDEENVQRSCKKSWRQIPVFSRTIRPITRAKSIILCARVLGLSPNSFRFILKLDKQQLKTKATRSVRVSNHTEDNA
jgi:hypothetical protein